MVVSKDVDIAIEKKEVELVRLRDLMEQLKTKFINETVRLATHWYEETVREYITKYSQITLNMTAERMARMKVKFNELVKNTEETVKAELNNNPALWWHQKPRMHESIDLYSMVGDGYPEGLDHAVRHVLGKLGKVLEEYSYNVTASGKTGSFEEFWFEQSNGAPQTVSFYPHLLKWTKEMENIVREYDKQYRQARAIFIEIRLLKEEKAKQKALSRWDSLEDAQILDDDVFHHGVG
jgi:hypothetical protein